MPTLSPSRAHRQRVDHLAHIAEAFEDFSVFLDFVWLTSPKGRIKFEKWPHLMELAEEWQAGESQCILKSRRLGLTWEAAAYSLWTMCQRGSSVLLLSQGEQYAKEMLEKVQFIYHELPAEMRAMIPLKSEEDKTEDGVWSKTEMKIAGGGKCRVLPSTKNAGRSYTASLVIADEAAFHKYAKENHAAYRPTVEGGGQIIIISTGNGISGIGAFFHDMFWASLAGNTSYRAKFVSWQARPDRNEHWYVEERRNYQAGLRDGDIDLFGAEFPSTPQEAFVAISGLVFPRYNDEMQRRSAPASWYDCDWRFAGVDFGGKSATAIVVVGVTGSGRVHVYDEFHRQYASTTQIGVYLNEWAASNGGAFDLVLCDYSEQTSIMDLVRGRIRAVNADKDRASGIRAMQNIVSSSRTFSVDPSCKNLRGELQSVRFDDVSQMEWAITRPNDTIDALRYALLHVSRLLETYGTNGEKVYTKMVF